MIGLFISSGRFFAMDAVYAIVKQFDETCALTSAATCAEREFDAVVVLFDNTKLAETFARERPDVEPHHYIKGFFGRKEIRRLLKANVEGLGRRFATINPQPLPDKLVVEEVVSLSDLIERV